MFHFFLSFFFPPAYKLIQELFNSHLNGTFASDSKYTLGSFTCVPIKS